MPRAESVDDFTTVEEAEAFEIDASNITSHFAADSTFPWVAVPPQSKWMSFTVADHILTVPVPRSRLLPPWEGLLLMERESTGESGMTPGLRHLTMRLVLLSQLDTRYDWVCTPTFDKGSWYATFGSVDIQPPSRVAEDIRSLTGLSVDRLAQMFGVSRVTYHNWISNQPVAVENEVRLRAVLGLLQEIADAPSVHARGIGNWLLDPVAAGTPAPLNMIAEGRDLAVKALALRLSPPSRGTSPISEAARARTGIPTLNLRRTGSRWQPGTAKEAREGTEQLSPSFLDEPNDPEPVDESDYGEGGRGLYAP